MSAASSLVGSFVEAWQELRIHKTRVLLSLIGVAVAVCAITAVVGLGAIAQQISAEQIERSSGRPATLFVSAYSMGAEPITAETLDEAYLEVVDRYSIGHYSRAGYGEVMVQFADGTASVQAQLADEAYEVIHRVELLEGRWLVEGDARRFAPAIVVNPFFYERLGSPDLRTHPTVQLDTDSPTTAVIVGVSNPGWQEDYPTMFMLPDSYAGLVDEQTYNAIAPQLEMWVPPEMADELLTILQRDISGALGEDAQVEVYRNDFAASGVDDPFLPVRLIIGGVAGLVLFLGALGLVNIALVTVKQRVREIGIRRSFGATAGRVFFSVMMESVVATIAAGIVGVGGAVAVVQNPLVIGWITQGQTIQDLPQFPLDVALLGLACAAGVGALAGLLPAIVAVRVKVIDAIRF